jgi:hypothetical protein
MLAIDRIHSPEETGSLGIAFREEHAGNALWYVQPEQGQADPAVHSMHPSGDPEQRDCTTFSEFALFTLVLEAMWHGERVYSEQFLEDLDPWTGPRTGLLRCQLACNYWVMGEVKLYEGVDVRLVNTADGYLFVTARNEKAFRALPLDLRAGLT